MLFEPRGFRRSRREWRRAHGYDTNRFVVGAFAALLAFYILVLLGRLIAFGA